MNRLPVTPLLLLLVTLTGCSRSNDDDDSGSSGSIQTFTTNWGADQSTPFAFLGDNFAYLAGVWSAPVP